MLVQGADDVVELYRRRCSDAIDSNTHRAGPFANAKDRSVFNTTPVYWQAERNTQNPFEYTVGPGFINSTCQFPGITS